MDLFLSTFSNPFPLYSNTPSPSLPAILIFLPSSKSGSHFQMSGVEERRGRGCLCQVISHPCASPLTAPTSPSGLLPSLLPSRPKKHHSPLPALSRGSREGAGSSEGHLQGVPPSRDATGWASRGGWQAQAGNNTEGSMSGFSGNVIAPRNNERATFPTFWVSVHSTAHIVLAPGEI